MDIITSLANRVCHRYQIEDKVVPYALLLCLFTLAAIDNIDHNPSSTTAPDSFHGTSISLFQQPSGSNPGVTRSLPSDLGGNHERNILRSWFTPRMVKLPDSYTMLPQIPYKKEANLLSSEAVGQVKGDGDAVVKALLEEKGFVLLLCLE